MQHLDVVLDEMINNYENNITEYSNGTLKSKLYGFDLNKPTESDIEG